MRKYHIYLVYMYICYVYSICIYIYIYSTHVYMLFIMYVYLSVSHIYLRLWPFSRGRPMSINFERTPRRVLTMLLLQQCFEIELFSDIMYF